MPSSLSAIEALELQRLLTIVADRDKGFLPDGAYEAVHKLVPWPAVEVALVNNEGALLLENRRFSNWPAEMSAKWGKPWNEIEGYYVPGGYVLGRHSIAQACAEHLEKDGVLAEFDYIGDAGNVKWMPGDHPFGNPISLVTICKLRDGTAPKFRRSPKDKWGDTIIPGKFVWARLRTVPTEVPKHVEVQEKVFRWVKEHPEHFKPK